MVDWIPYIAKPRSGISHSKASVSLLPDVRLHIAHGGFHESSSGRGGIRHDNLVTYEESNDVGVALERIDHALHCKPIIQLVVPRRICPVDMFILRPAQIYDEVYSCVGEGIHTLGMVVCWINDVSMHDICSYFQQIRDISLACRWVRKWIYHLDGIEHERTAVLIRDASNEEFGAIGLIEEVRSLRHNNQLLALVGCQWRHTLITIGSSAAARAMAMNVKSQTI